jgi:hypothetical protein
MTSERATEIERRWFELRNQLAAFQRSGEINSFTDPPEDVEKLMDEFDAIEHEFGLAGHKDFPFRRIEWGVMCVNSKTRERFDRRLVLDNSIVPPDDMREIRRILRKNYPKSGWSMLKYRRYLRKRHEKIRQKNCNR